MPFSTALLSALLGLGLAQENQLLPRIVNGVVTADGEFPFIGRLTRYEAHYQGQMEACPGMLLNPYTVLTTSTCNSNPDGDPDFPVTMEAGNHGFNDHEIEVNVTEVVSYKSIALAHLQSPIYKRNSTYIGYATLPEQGYRPSVGDNITMAGWGQEDNQEPYGSIYELKTTLPVTDTASCKKMYDDLNGYIEFTDDMYCAGFSDDRTGGCGADQGDGVMDPATKTLVGVWWDTEGCNTPGYPDLIINVGDYVDYIKAHMWTS